MPSPKDEYERAAPLQGTLDLLILRTLVLGSRHGQGISRSIRQQSEDVFLVDHGSLYLALHGWRPRGMSELRGAFQRTIEGRDSAR